MLKNLTQGIFKPSTTSPLSMLSLTTTPMYFHARRKHSKAEKIRRYLNNPRFKKVVKMKMPNFNDPNMTFPVTVPLRTTFVYRVSKTKPRLPEHDFINFKGMTGNEILINLENAEHLRPSELSAALLELGRREGASEIDWNNHDWIKKCVDIVIKNLPQYNGRAVATLLWAFHRLNIKEPLLWSSLARESDKTVHKLKGKGLGLTFIVFASEPERCTREYKERLASLLPIHIQNMNPEVFTKCFELVLKEGLMTDYLFHDNFFMVIWKKTSWLGARHFPTLVNGLLEYGYLEDLEFWNQEFIPVIDKLVEKMSATQAEKILASIRLAKEKIPRLEIAHQENLLNERVVFANTTLKRLENAKFWNIVKNDIEYYRQKEKLRMEKERGKAHA